MDSTSLGYLPAHGRQQPEPACPLVSPAPAAKVLSTLDHQWDGLARHLDHPDLPLDNNPAERALRGPIGGPQELLRRRLAGLGTPGCPGLDHLCDRRARRRQPLAYLDACGAAAGRPLQGEALARFLPWQASPTDLAAWHNGDGPAP
jgi:transposase